MNKRLIAAGIAAAATVAVLTAASASEDRPATTCEDVPYSNVTPDYPGWEDSFDGNDNDGIGCENNDGPDWRTSGLSSDTSTTTTVPVAEPATPEQDQPTFTG